MRQRLFIISTIVLVLVVLIALNAASYVRVEQPEDTEWNPDRSTYNAGATGTKAFYDFLSESGHQVIRWRESPAALLDSRKAKPGTLVVVGKTIVPFDHEEAETLLRWVAGGGRLVLIDRRPDARLLPSSGDWQVSTEISEYPAPMTLSDNPEGMTEGVKPARPSQPTLLTLHVESVLPSRYAGLINISQRKAEKKAEDKTGSQDSSGDEDEDADSSNNNPLYGPPPTPDETYLPHNKENSKPVSPAPTVQLANDKSALLVDYPHGAGRIIVLSDPFIIANNGISRADNLILATNVVTSAGGIIAFDEYHQGRAITQNELLAYFAGTPVLPMLAQAGLIVLAVLWTSGRRFARPLPLPRVDRRSKLEFVASMAELQQRARAYDLAIENVYSRTRRVLARYGGVDSTRSRSEIAAAVAARSRLDQKSLEDLMAECENAINGEPVDARKSLKLVARLRQLERDLGLRMRSREIRQAKERQL